MILISPIWKETILFTGIVHSILSIFVLRFHLKHLCSALPWSSEDFKTKMFNSKGLPTFSKISLVISYYAASCAVSYSDTDVSCYGLLTSKRVHVNWDMGHQSAALKSGVCHHFFQFGARVSRNFLKGVVSSVFLRNWTIGGQKIKCHS